MPLGTRTVQKFIRESLVSGTPMTVTQADLAGLKQRLHALFKQGDEMRFQWHDDHGSGRPGERRLCSFSVRHPRHDYWSGGFSLILDPGGALHLADYRLRHPVGSEDELLAFIRLCRERAVRIRGQHNRQAKVRNLRTAAIVAWVQKLARAMHFDYSTEEGQARLLLLVRFGAQDVVELAIPYARFQEVMPAVEAALPALRELGTAGVSAVVKPRQGKYAPRRRPWVLHQSLAAAPQEE